MRNRSYAVVSFVLLMGLGCSDDGSRDQDLLTTPPPHEVRVEDPDDGSVLPFPRPSSASTARPSIHDSEHVWRTSEPRLESPPNILLVMLDDGGFGHPSAFGGDIRTPALERLANDGIAYNRFHTTAICSPTRAALLTGRNHHRVGSGVISELATDFDGYSGEIPHTAALLPEVLGAYGYGTAAFGKWHNTPTPEVTASGPFDQWPTGRGFDHFYGFMGGETSQYEPRLYRDITPVEPPHHDPEYHLTTDLADQAISFMRAQESLAPERPWFVYFAPGAVHGPHHVQREWAEKYAGRFDEGWDAMRERIFARQQAMGWIPADAELTPRPEGLPAWEDVPENERAFQLRLMETFAGFLEQTDSEVNRLLDEVDNLGQREETLVIYVFSDNGASAEGQNGTLFELLAQNGIPTTVAQQMAVLDGVYGGIDAIGSPKVDNMYHAAWAWAGGAPLLSTKLVSGHFGGTRTPMVISWPGHIAPDDTPRSQFHHVNDVAPTIYDVLGIPLPRVVDGHEQLPMDGVSMAYSFAAPDAPGRHETQYFECLGSRGLYHEGWMASVFGPRVPWVVGSTDLGEWHQENDPWELYDLRSDYSQAHDVASDHPDKLAELQALFAQAAEENAVYPVGGGLFAMASPEAMVRPGRTSWTFAGGTVRTPENASPKIGTVSNRVEVDAIVPAEGEGVLYALGGVAGGITLYMDGGRLFWEFNLLGMQRTKIATEAVLPAGDVRIVVETRMEGRPGSPAAVTLNVDGAQVGAAQVPVSLPLGFSATETFDVGTDLGSPVALEYFERAPFAFNGEVRSVEVRYLQ